MVCTHNIQHLIGMSSGVLCRNCGQKFETPEEIENVFNPQNSVSNEGENKPSEETPAEAENAPKKGRKSRKKVEE